MRGTNGARLTTGVACLALALSACSSGGGGGSARSSTLAAVSATSGGTATVKGAEPQNPLYPADTVDPGGTAIVQRLFRGLVRYDAKGKAVDEVAKSIRTDDHRTCALRDRAGQDAVGGGRHPVDLLALDRERPRGGVTVGVVCHGHRHVVDDDIVLLAAQCHGPEARRWRSSAHPFHARR